MNIIFGFVLILSTIILVFISPDGVLSAMLSGGEKALALTLKMVVVYAVWMGVFEMLERAKLSNVIARCLKPVNRFLFGAIPEKANDFISLNISANILGMSGATTPMGIKAIQELEKLSQRLEAAILLNEGCTYEQVIEKTKISSTTLSRVSRCIRYGDGGYALVIEKIKK